MGGAGRNISLSAKYYIPVASGPNVQFSEYSFKYASSVRMGDWVWDLDGAAEVISMTVSLQRGLFNPYTKSGPNHCWLIDTHLYRQLSLQGRSLSTGW